MLDNESIVGSSGSDNQVHSLSSMEIDTIGEILNISMGSAATSVSALLGRKVNITTPVVTVVNVSDILFDNLQPAIGIEIEYIKGLSGSNLMFMKRTDIKAIVELLVSGMDDMSEEEMNEMQISAISEIMNQMMGASSTALASFFNKPIDISTPKHFDPINILDKIRESYNEDTVVCVKFVLEVEDLLQSEFATVMTMDFTREIVDNALNFGDDESASDNSSSPDVVEEIPVEAKQIPPQVIEVKKEEDKEVKKEEKPVSSPPAKAPPPRPTEKAAQTPQQQVNVKPVKLRSFDEEDEDDRFREENKDNFNLIMGVPLEVTVEIGRTSMLVKNILQLRQGSIVELNKQAGDPVDVIVNGQLIARGDVVIIDDNFGVRITEIVSKNEIANSFN